MRALVTGASGFIGGRLAEALVGRGIDVSCLVRKTSRTEALDRLGVRLAFGDVTDADSLIAAAADVDVVYHLAGAIRGFGLQDFLRINETGCAHAARACVESARQPVLVVVSSLAAAGPAEGDAAIHEETPVRPVSNYGESKLAGERAAAVWAARTPISIVRPPIVFGAGDPAMLAMFRPISRFGVHVVPGFHDRRFSLVHADDLCAAIIAVGERGRRLPADWRCGEGESPGVYYVAFDEQPSYADLGRMIGAALGKTARVLRLPETVAWTAATAAEIYSRTIRRPAIFNRDKMREATAGSWVCSASRAKKELGFRPTLSLAERLRHTAEWYRAQGWL